MKAFPKFAVLFAVALLASAAVAASAQAVSINPDNTAVSGTASEPTLDYQGTTVVCDTGTADGTTGTDSDFVDLSLEFFGNCNISGLGAAVNCDGTARLIALNATDDTGTVDLNSGFSCDVVVSGICTVSVDGPQNPNNAVSLADLDEGADTLATDVDVAATRTGSSLCGPASGTANFTGLYATTPANLTVDP